MTKVIIQVALFRFGVNKFERDLNTHLAGGWDLRDLRIEKKGFKTICVAIIDRPDAMITDQSS